MIRIAIPEKIAPATKKAPKSALSQGTRMVIAKIHETTVWTDTAIGMIRIIRTPMAEVRERHWAGRPCQPIARVRYSEPRQRELRPASRSRKRARSGIIGTKRYVTLAVREVGRGRGAPTSGGGPRPHVKTVI